MQRSAAARLGNRKKRGTTHAKHMQLASFGGKQATLRASPSTPPNSTLNTLSRAEQTHSRSLRAHPRRADPPPSVGVQVPRARSKLTPFPHTVLGVTPGHGSEITPGHGSEIGAPLYRDLCLPTDGSMDLDCWIHGDQWTSTGDHHSGWSNLQEKVGRRFLDL